MLKVFWLTADGLKVGAGLITASGWALWEVSRSLWFVLPSKAVLPRGLAMNAESAPLLPGFVPLQTPD